MKLTFFPECCHLAARCSSANRSSSSRQLSASAVQAAAGTFGKMTPATFASHTRQRLKAGSFNAQQRPALGTNRAASHQQLRPPPSPQPPLLFSGTKEVYASAATAPPRKCCSSTTALQQQRCLYTALSLIKAASLAASNSGSVDGSSAAPAAAPAFEARSTLRLFSTSSPNNNDGSPNNNDGSPNNNHGSPNNNHGSPNNDQGSPKNKDGSPNTGSGGCDSSSCDSSSVSGDRSSRSSSCSSDSSSSSKSSGDGSSNSSSICSSSSSHNDRDGRLQCSVSPVSESRTRTLNVGVVEHAQQEPRFCEGDQKIETKTSQQCVTTHEDVLDSNSNISPHKDNSSNRSSHGKEMSNDCSIQSGSDDGNSLNSEPSFLTSGDCCSSSEEGKNSSAEALQSSASGSSAPHFCGADFLSTANAAAAAPLASAADGSSGSALRLLKEAVAFVLVARGQSVAEYLRKNSSSSNASMVQQRQQVLMPQEAGSFAGYAGLLLAYNHKYIFLKDLAVDIGRSCREGAVQALLLLTSQLTRATAATTAKTLSSSTSSIQQRQKQPPKHSDGLLDACEPKQQKSSVSPTEETPETSQDLHAQSSHRSSSASPSRSSNSNSSSTSHSQDNSSRPRSNHSSSCSDATKSKGEKVLQGGVAESGIADCTGKTKRTTTVAASKKVDEKKFQELAALVLPDLQSCVAEPLLSGLQTQCEHLRRANLKIQFEVVGVKQAIVSRVWTVVGSRAGQQAAPRSLCLVELLPDLHAITAAAGLQHQQQQLLSVNEKKYFYFKPGPLLVDAAASESPSLLAERAAAADGGDFDDAPISTSLNKSRLKTKKPKQHHRLFNDEAEEESDADEGPSTAARSSPSRRNAGASTGVAAKDEAGAKNLSKKRGEEGSETTQEDERETSGKEALPTQRPDPSFFEKVRIFVEKSALANEAAEKGLVIVMEAKVLCSQVLSIQDAQDQIVYGSDNVEDFVHTLRFQLLARYEKTQMFFPVFHPSDWTLVDWNNLVGSEYPVDPQTLQNAVVLTKASDLPRGEKFCFE